jgi:hypothetical protein
MLGRILANMNPLTEYAIAFVSLVGIYFQVFWSRRGIALGPTLLTTLGIFFCFLGIALGLADFDPNDVKSSVPHLLQGIRTSFWVSVSGIGWALTIKIRFVMFGDPSPAAGNAGGASIDDLASELISLNSSISGTGDSSLTSRMRLGQSDNAERLERLIHAFETNTQATAEANAKALIQVLADVVRDFNSKLDEQFGENFKQLNAGVERLVTWQIQYERQLNTLIERETAMSQSMLDASLRHQELVANSGAFAATAESLKELLTTLNGEREKLADGMLLLAGLVDKASLGLPTIEKNIVEMTDQIARGVQANQEMLASVLKSSWQSVQVHGQHLTAILAKSLETATRDAAAHQRQLSEAPQTQQVA